MPVIRRTPRVLALLVVCLFMLAGCASRDVAPPPPPDHGGSTNPMSNPCAGGKGNRSPNTPIVCVDDTGATLSVHPDPVMVHDVGVTDRKPVVIQWYTVSGSNNLGVEMNEGCTTTMTCRGNRCTARTIPHKQDETGERRCKYDVWTDKHPRLDPDTVIVKCCTLAEPSPEP